MLPRLSTLWLSVGTAFLATTVDAASTSPSLCDLNTLAYTHKRFWGTCTKYGEVISQYLALAFDFGDFGMITPINAFGFSTIEPSQGSFNFVSTESLVSYWQGNTKARLWIHSLLHITGLPSWLTSASSSQATLAAVIQNYAVEFTHGMLSARFSRMMALGVRTFFTIPLGPITSGLPSRQLSAKLYIEEYSAEPVNVKSNAFYSLAQQLKNSQVPFDGMGFEGHVVAG
ncbi:hypothetical protein FRC05_000838 [Tulasnella sp. 425]|nr:hypothetical protein FRC05_000838 [Tulasnella sp. 425]